MKLFKNDIITTFMDERFFLFIVIIILSLFSCGNSSSEDDYAGITGTFEQLPQLPDPYEYKIWLYENSNTRLVSTFNVGEDKKFQLAAAPQSQIIADANEIVVTIEDSNEVITSPSGNEIVGARFTSNDQSDVKTYPITADFSSVSGAIKSIVPNDNSHFIVFKENEESFLNLPTLKEGWHYSFWYEINNEEKMLLSFDNADDLEGILIPDIIIGAKFRLAVESDLFDYSYGSLGMYILELTIQDIEEAQEFVPTLENLPTGIITKEK